MTYIANVQDINKLFHMLKIINNKWNKENFYMIYNLSMYLQTNEPHKT